MSMKAEGWDVTAQLVSVVKSAVNAKRRREVVAAPAPEAGPVVPKDAVSLGQFRKAKNAGSTGQQHQRGEAGD
jgi:hypothetical protein